MGHPQLAIFGYSEAAMFLLGTSGADVAAILSIHGKREFGVEAEVPRRLDLTFDDVEVPRPDDEVGVLRAASLRRWGELNGLVQVAPVRTDAAAIVRFAEGLRGVKGMVLCHCGGGMSRAPAAALICLAVWHGEGREAEAVAEVLRLRRGAVPHEGLVRMADEVLGRGGRLVDALGQAVRRRDS